MLSFHSSRARTGAGVSVIAGVLVLAAVPAFAAIPVAGETQLVSVSALGVQSGGLFGTLSADGRYVAYLSSDEVVPGVPGGTFQVYRRDLVTGETVLVSADDAGVPANAILGQAKISGDGQYVAFETNATNLDVRDTSTDTDIYIRDIVAGTIDLVSVNLGATASGNASSLTPSVSADGSTVSFKSDASNLVAIDTNTQTDVFVRNLTTGTTELVSVTSAGVQGDAASGFEESPMSADGRYVAFDSFATNLGGSPGSSQVLVRDRVLASTTLVSADTGGGGVGDGSSGSQSISDDGSTVAFSSVATDLVAGDTNSRMDVFVRALSSGVTTLISTPTTAGVPADSSAPSISGDGLFVAFESDARNLVEQPTTGTGDLFLRSLLGGTTSLISVNAAGSAGGNGYSFAVSLSSNGSVATFTSDASDLVAADSGLQLDQFARGVGVVSPTAVVPQLAATGSSNVLPLGAIAIGLIALGLLAWRARTSGAAGNRATLR